MAINFLGTSVTGDIYDVKFNGTIVEEAYWKDKQGVCTLVYKVAPLRISNVTCVCGNCSANSDTLNTGYGTLKATLDGTNVTETFTPSGNCAIVHNCVTICNISNETYNIRISGTDGPMVFIGKIGFSEGTVGTIYWILGDNTKTNPSNYGTTCTVTVPGNTTCVFEFDTQNKVEASTFTFPYSISSSASVTCITLEDGVLFSNYCNLTTGCNCTSCAAIRMY